MNAYEKYNPIVVNMKILLISANTITTPYPVYPLGLDYVANAITKDHQVKIADINSMGDNDALGNVIIDFSPDIIGISLRNIDNTDSINPEGFTTQYQNLIKKIQTFSKAPIVIGGSGFTIFASELMNALEADYGIIGEGERLALLLKALQNREDVSGIHGVITREKEDNILAPLCDSFDRSFNADSPHLQFYLQKGGMLNLQTMRGCKYKCIYCTYPYIEGKRIRFIPPEEVAHTAHLLQDANARYLYITDSVFNADNSHSIEVAHAFVKAGISVPWGAFFMPTKPPKDFYRILSDAGLKHVEFGTDSLSNKLLKTYRKPFQVSHVFHAHKAAIEAGLNVAHYFLPGGPGDNLDSLTETLINIDKLNKAVFFFFCGMRIYPYTALYEIAVDEGQILRSQSLLDPVFYHSESLPTKEIVYRIEKYAKGRINWVIGSISAETTTLISRMYARGYSGPLWEYLIR